MTWQPTLRISTDLVFIIGDKLAVSLKLLILEQDAELRAQLQDLCEQANYSVDAVGSVPAAREKLAIYSYDCILVDCSDPVESRNRFLELVRSSKKNEGLIVISPFDSLDDKITSLDLGADDYMSKPFHFSELNARIQAVVRRKKFDTTDVVMLSNVKMDLARQVAWANDHALGLTKKEFEILQHLIANKNRKLSKNAIAEYIWGDHVDTVSSFDFLFVHIKNLRKKLETAGARVEISNTYGVGYQVHEI